MRISWYSIITFLFLLSGCRPQDVQVTITYDKNPSNGFPYIYYGETAKIYYTIGAQNFEKTVQIHRSIQFVVPEKTDIRITYDKFISDQSGQRSTLEDAYYKVKSSTPAFVVK